MRMFFGSLPEVYSVRWKAAREGEKMKKIGGMISLFLVFALVLSACAGNNASSSPSGSASADQAANGPVITHETNGTAQKITYVHSTETTPAVKTSDARTLYVGAYGENYVTSTLSTVGYNNLIAISLIYDTLFAKNFETGEIECRIAESYEFIEDQDGPILHIVIRDNLHFQSGDPITAADCYDSTVGRFAKTGTVRTYLGNTVDVDHSWYEGDRDLYIRLYQYDRTILDALSCQWFNVGNTSFEENATENDLWDKVDGSGPFIVQEQISGDSVTLKVDDSYWGWGVIEERPNYGYMVVKFYSEASIMLIDYENEKLDCCLGLGSADTERILSQGMEHTNLKLVSSGNYTVMCMPAYKKVFSDPRVREAIFCAVDTDAAAEAAYGALGNQMDAYVSSMAPYRKEYQTDKYDPERARQLLEEAGYRDGELAFNTVVSSNDSASTALAEIIQAYLAEVGIRMTIESYDFATAVQLQRNGSVGLCITTFYTMNGDISGCFIQLPEGSYNKAAWLTQLDPELKQKLLEGRYTKSETEAEQAYAWVQDWLDENMWYLPIVEYNTAFLSRDYVDSSGFYNLMHARDIRNLDLIAH